MLIKKVLAFNKAFFFILSTSSILLRHSVTNKQILFDKVANTKKKDKSFSGESPTSDNKMSRVGG
jgi:hypothetical protein